jgi:hypothetical protein
VTVGGNTDHDTIIVGNGNNDSIQLNTNFSGTATGGDTIVTGTGANDTVKVGTHTNPDTFGFAIGTDGTSFTTIFGAQSLDHVISDKNLHNVTNVSNVLPSTATLADFITSLALKPGNTTYVGNNGTDTFIVTEQGSHIGAVELVGVFTSSTISGHELILGL